jgi:hypothetical protein
LLISLEVLGFPHDFQSYVKSDVMILMPDPRPQTRIFLKVVLSIAGCPPNAYWAFLQNVETKFSLPLQRIWMTLEQICLMQAFALLQQGPAIIGIG